MSPVGITLPCGFFASGSWHRSALLHPLSGHDEAFLNEDAFHLSPAGRATALLVRSLDELGPEGPVTPERVSALTVGDRDALLLHLRRITFGERIDCTLTCPAANCGEKMDLEIKVADLLSPPYTGVETVHQAALKTEKATFSVRFRLPTGADQEAAASLATRDMESAVNCVLERCVEEVALTDAVPAILVSLPHDVKALLAALMGELDPQAELKLNLACPVCQHSFGFVFDPIDYVLNELTGRRGRLYREVHVLAYNYHWSESEILGMTTQKRWLYLSLLSEGNPSGAI